MSTLNLENIKHPDSASNNISVDSSGRVGIGTASPDELLHVKSTVAARFQLESTGTNEVGVQFLSNNASPGTNFVNFGDSGDGNVGQIKYDHSSNFMSFTTNASERMRIDSAGRVTMPYQPMFSGYNADGTQTLTRNIHWTAYTNVGNHMATSTGVFTCPVAGKYFCSFSSLSQASSGNEISVLQNGSFELRMWDDGSDWAQLAGGGILDCSANDTLEFYSNGRLVHGGKYTFASIHLIG